MNLPLNAYFRLSRLHKPAGIFLLLLPCWWGVALAHRFQTISLKDTVEILVLFALGATLMRGAGCTLNDLIDRQIDCQVIRTQSRPLASGELTPCQGVVFSMIQCLAGGGILLVFPISCWIISPIALLLLIIYPFMKRITYWPQAFLGLAFNSGVFFGVLSLVSLEKIDWLATVALYGAGIAWTLGYDTIYALQDKEDDLKIGVKSTAIRFGSHVKTGLFFAYGFLFLVMSWIGYRVGGYSLEGTLLYYVILAIGAVETVRRLIQLDPDHSAQCLKAFNANIMLGGLVWSALLALGV